MPESPPPSDRPSPPPSYLLDGRYLCLELIARGATTEVYSGSDTWSGEQVCIRMLRRDRRDAAAPFRRTAERMFGLTSARFVRAIAFGDDHDGLPFLVTELLVGRGVEKLSRVRWEVAAEIVRHAALAVSEMHLNNLVHGSLRPSTLFVTASAEGGPRVKLLDLGQGDRRATPAGDCRELAEIMVRLLTGIAIRPPNRPLELTGAPPELTAMIMRWASPDEVTHAPEIATLLRELLDPEGAMSTERPSAPVGELLVLPKSGARIG